MLNSKTKGQLFMPNQYVNKVQKSNGDTIIDITDTTAVASDVATDLLLYNPKLIKKYQYSSNYLGVPTERTEDWCLITDSSGYVKKLAIGGTDCYHLFGVSYWSEEDGKKLCAHLDNVYNSVPGGKERYWDQVAFDYYLSEYKIQVRPCSFSDIVEIDTFNELKKIDSSYAM